MKPVKFILLLLSTLIVTTLSANNGKLPKYITYKKKVITFESNNILHIKGTDSYYNSLEKNISYFIFYNDYTYTKVSEEYFKNINIGDIK